MDLTFSAITAAAGVLEVLVLFRVNPRLGGFTLGEGLLIASLAVASFSLSELVVGNIDHLSAHVRRGWLDAVLVRPLSTLGQLMVGDFSLRRIGGVLEGIIVFALACLVSEVDWTPTKVLLCVIAPISGAVIFGSIFVAGSTVAFYWSEVDAIQNAVTHGGRDFAKLPTNIYGAGYRIVFGFVLGLGFVAYFPALALLGRPDRLAILGWCSPFVACGWAVVASCVWRLGVRRYRSTGS